MLKAQLESRHYHLSEAHVESTNGSRHYQLSEADAESTTRSRHCQ